MSPLLQDLLAGLAVLLAIAWLVRRTWKRRRANAAPCGDCPGCGAGAPAPARPTTSDLVTITPLE